MIQEHVEELVEHNSEAENQIINWLLQCLDLLYSNFPEKDANTLKVSVTNIAFVCRATVFQQNKNNFCRHSNG